MASWPVDSPLSAGLGFALLLVFALSVLMMSNPTLFDRDPSKVHAEQNYKDARNWAIGSGVLAVVVLYFSWASSNNDRYAFLDQ